MLKQFFLVFLLAVCPLMGCADSDAPAKTVAAVETVAQETEKTVEKVEATVADLVEEKVIEVPTSITKEAPSSPVSAGDTSKFKAGEHYRVLTPKQRTSSEGDVVEVAEIFMYSCPHCYSFETFIKGWRKEQGDNVNFVRIPAIFNKIAVQHAKAFYTAEALDIFTEEFHSAFFSEYHVKRNPLADQKSLAAFFAKFGVEKDQFNETFNSFGVSTRLRDAQKLGDAYGVTSVPMVVVNGHYVTQGSMAGSEQNLRDVMNMLVEKEKASL